MFSTSPGEYTVHQLAFKIYIVFDYFHQQALTQPKNQSRVRHQRESWLSSGVGNRVQGRIDMSGLTFIYKSN